MKRPFDRLFAVNVNVNIPHGVGGGSADEGKAERSDLKCRLDRRHSTSSRPDLVQRNQSGGEQHLKNDGGRTWSVQYSGQCDLPGDWRIRYDGRTLWGWQDTPENRKKFEATIPLGRFSTPRDIANAAVFLGSDTADFLTGMEFVVDGGRTV